MAGNSLIGALRVSLGLDSASFESGIKKAQGSLGGMASFAGKAGGIIGVALAGVATGFAVAAKAAIDHADEISKAAQKIGFSVEALSRLEYAAELSDVSLDQLTGGLKKLAVGMNETAETGKGKAAGAFRALGVAVVDANGKLRDGDQVMIDLAGKFGPMEDGARKTALAVALFGKSGADMIPLLNSGADGLREMAAESDALGLTLDEKTAKGAEAFNDNLTRLGAAGRGVTTQLTAAMLPGLQAVSETFVDGAKNAELMAGVSGILNLSLKTLATQAAIVGFVFEGVSKSIGAVTKAFAQAKSGDWAGAWKTLNTPVSNLGDLGTKIKNIWAADGTGMKPNAPKAATPSGAPPGAVAKASKAEKKEVDDSGKELAAAYERVHDSLLSDAERRSQEFSEQLSTLQQARARGLVTEGQYLEDFERLQNKFRERIQAAPLIEPKDLVGPLEGMADGEFLAGIDALARDLQDAANQADEVSFGIQDIFYGLKGNNWTQAAAGITRALASVKNAFAEGKTSAEKFAAVAGLAQGVGSVIGGTAGGAISGAASGALTGFKLGSVIPGVGSVAGAAIGGILGGIGSLFGSSKAKKQAKAQERERLAQEAAAKALDIANQKRSLEIAIMRAQGDEAGAVAAERADELAATDESNRGLVEQLYKLRDAADAAAKAADAAAKAQEIADERHGLEIALMEASGDAAGALAARRRDELAALDESNRGLQQAIYDAQDYADKMERVSQAAMEARDAQVDALQEQADALNGVVDKFRSFADSLREFRASLAQQSNTLDNYAGAAAAFRSTASRARLGDEKALGSLQGVSEKFLAVSRDSAKTQFDYLKDLGLVKRAVDAAADTADRTADIAQGQLDGIKQSVEQLQSLDLSVKGLQGSVSGLSVSILAQIKDADLRATAIEDAARAAALTDINMAKEIADLRASVEAGLAAVAGNTGATARTLDEWNANGQPGVAA